MEIGPDTYAREAKGDPLILGAGAGGISIRWPLVAAPAPVAADLGGRELTVSAVISRGHRASTPRAPTLPAAIAAAAACTALGVDLGRLSATVSGEARAGDAAAIAAIAIAAARRLPIRESTAIIGGLLPDGSLAGHPTVADIDAAAKAGVKSLGIPAGTRNAYDASRKGRVDLVSHGKAAGVEVVEVVDLAAAFAVLTKEALPQPPPVTSEQMELPGEVDRRIDALYQSWRQRLAPAWSKVLERGEARLGDRERRMIERLHRAVAAAEKEHAGGQVASALVRIRAAFATARALSRLGGRPLPEPEREAERAALAAAIDEALESIRADAGGNRGETIGRVARAWRIAAARTLIAGDGALDIEREATARMLLTAAAGSVELEGSWGSTAPITGDRLATLTGAHRHHATALGHPPATLELEAARPADALIRFAHARRAHLDAWIAVARADLLALERHPKTAVVIAARQPKAIERLLELADAAARRQARAALIAAGDIPISARVAYQAARALRGGDLLEKLEALERYWESAWLSELAAIISR